MRILQSRWSVVDDPKSTSLWRNQFAQGRRAYNKLTHLHKYRKHQERYPPRNDLGSRSAGDLFFDDGTHPMNDPIPEHDDKLFVTMNLAYDKKNGRWLHRDAQAIGLLMVIRLLMHHCTLRECCQLYLSMGCWCLRRPHAWASPAQKAASAQEYFEKHPERRGKRGQGRGKRQESNYR